MINANQRRQMFLFKDLCPNFILRIFSVGSGSCMPEECVLYPERFQ